MAEQDQVPAQIDPIPPCETPCALLLAAMQSDHLAHKGDEAGKRVWLLVMDAIKKLSGMKSGGHRPLVDPTPIRFTGF